MYEALVYELMIGNDPLPAGVALRPVSDRDREFLADLYASTREEELAAVPWPPEMKRAFLRQQFDAQDAHYRANYPGATLDVITRDDVPIGRLYVYRSASEIRLMDVALAAEARGQGLGTVFLQRVCGEAAALGLPVTVHVERMNPALRLYQRLGFVEIEDRGVYLFLQWRAPSQPPD